jgi:hypothetical protein
MLSVFSQFSMGSRLRGNDVFRAMVLLESWERQ